MTQSRLISMQWCCDNDSSQTLRHRPIERRDDWHRPAFDGQSKICATEALDALTMCNPRHHDPHAMLHAITANLSMLTANCIRRNRALLCFLFLAVLFIPLVGQAEDASSP